MKTNVAIKPPVWYWVVSGFAFLWNLLGVLAYLGEAFKADADIAALPESQRLLYEAQPSWFTGAFAIAVWAGIVGCLALLLRKKWARPILLISLIGIVVQMSYLFFMSDTFAVLGDMAMIMPIAIILVGLALVFFADKANKNNWLT
tara:strand:+ start:3847 stop:4284 length:438 start_codon:yes stop_codon:yes gene_type:complete